MRCVMVTAVVAFVFLFIFISPELNISPPKDGYDNWMQTNYPESWD